MTFRVGERVVCVDALIGNYTPYPAGNDLHGLKKGQIYTVRSILSFGGIPLIRVYEIKRDFNWRLGAENAYAAARFRPLVSRKSEISFTQGADPSTDKLDNRRKSRVPA